MQISVLSLFLPSKASASDKMQLQPKLLHLFLYFDLGDGLFLHLLHLSRSALHRLGGF